MANEMTEGEEQDLKWAMACDEWPIWLHEIVDEAAKHYVDKWDMSTEQAIAYAIAVYRRKHAESP